MNSWQWEILIAKIDFNFQQFLVFDGILFQQDISPVRESNITIHIIFLIITVLSMVRPMYQWQWIISIIGSFTATVSLSVCLLVCLSVRQPHLLYKVAGIISSWHFQEQIPLTEVMSMQKAKVICQILKSQGTKRSLILTRIWVFLLYNSSFNSSMSKKWCKKFEVA